MTHDTHTESLRHKELSTLGEEKLWSLVEDWDPDKIRLPLIEEVLVGNRVIRVVRDDLSGFGTKARAGLAVFHQPEYRKVKTVVYVAPRVGWAPMSLAKLCQQTRRRLVLFAPAASEPSQHQLVAQSLGAELRYFRVAAMPVLQRRAKAWAEAHGYTFFPLGLDVPAAVAGIAKTARAAADFQTKGGYKAVKEVWCVISTGVLSRGLQLAFPAANHFAVAVARNIKEGERGKIVQLFSHTRGFHQRATVLPPFPSVLTYDAKAWEYIVRHASDGALFWNVAAEPPVTAVCTDRDRRASNVEWGDESAFLRP